MRKRTAKEWSYGIIISMALLMLWGNCLAVDFAADFSEKQGDNIKSGKLFVTDTGYRMEVTESAGKIIVIVNPAQKKTIVIPVSTKEYRELAIDDMTSVMNDPFQSYEYTKSFGEESSAGSENVAGYECDKYQITMNDVLVMTKWVSQKLGFPIKIMAHGSPERIIEVTNIKEGPVDKSLFQIPEGYTKWVDPSTLPPEPPEWAGKIANAPVLKPPFEHEMKAGDILRIKTEPGKSIKIKAVNKGSDEAVGKAVPFKGDLPIKDIKRINNFAQKGVICSRIHETPAEADEVVLHVDQGDITVLGRFEEMSEKTVTAGEEFRFPVAGHDNIEARYVNLSDGTSAGNFTFYKSGKMMSDDEIGPAKYRNVILKEKGDVKKSAYVPKGDELVFKAEKGKFLVKYGQFDSFEF